MRALCSHFFGQQQLQIQNTKQSLVGLETRISALEKLLGDLLQSIQVAQKTRNALKDALDLLKTEVMHCVSLLQQLSGRADQQEMATAALAERLSALETAQQQLPTLLEDSEEHLLLSLTESVPPSVPAEEINALRERLNAQETVLQQLPIFLQGQLGALQKRLMTSLASSTPQPVAAETLLSVQKRIAALETSWREITSLKSD